MSHASVCRSILPKSAQINLAILPCNRRSQVERSIRRCNPATSTYAQIVRAFYSLHKILQRPFGDVSAHVSPHAGACFRPLANVAAFATSEIQHCHALAAQLQSSHGLCTQTTKRGSGAPRNISRVSYSNARHMSPRLPPVLDQHRLDPVVQVAEVENDRHVPRGLFRTPSEQLSV